MQKNKDITFNDFRRTEQSVGVPAYKTHMRLIIHNINPDDYSTYKCVAKNRKYPMS